MSNLKFSILVLLWVWVSSSFAQPDIQLTPYINGLSSPTDIAFAPGSNLIFVAERDGKIKWIDQNMSVGTLLDLSPKVISGSELGLLGLIFDPDFQTNRKMYVNYTRSNQNKIETVISAFTVTDSTLKNADVAEEVILIFEQLFANHNGGDLAFGSDGYLYVATGDGGDGGDPQNQGQQLNTLLGKILRIDVSVDSGYAIPPDNPFVDTAGMDEIWLYGLRNPWRFSFDRVLGDCWIADVGQRLWEEISTVPPSGGGRNLGWRCFEGYAQFSNCDEIVHHEPIYAYAHNRNCGDNNFCGNSITGGFIYRGQAFPNMSGHYLFADYDTNILWSLTLDSGGNSQVLRHIQSNPISEISTFGEDNEGELWAASLNGIIYKVSDANITSTTNIFTIPEFRLFPNPTKSIVALNSSIPFSTVNIACFDVMGRRYDLKHEGSGSEAIIDIKPLPTGTYVIFISDKNNNWIIPSRLIIFE